MIVCSLPALIFASGGDWLEAGFFVGMGALLFTFFYWISPAVTAVGCETDGERVTFHLTFGKLTTRLDQIEATSAREATIGLFRPQSLSLTYLPALLYVRVRERQKPFAIQMKWMDDGEWKRLKRHGDFVPLDQMVKNSKALTWLAAALLVLYVVGYMYLMHRAGIEVYSRRYYP